MCGGRSVINTSPFLVPFSSKLSTSYGLHTTNKPSVADFRRISDHQLFAGLPFLFRPAGCNRLRRAALPRAVATLAAGALRTVMPTQPPQPPPPPTD